MDRFSAQQALSSAPSGQFVGVMTRVLKFHQEQGDWLTIRQMAQLADMSVRSFQRRLANEEVVFSELVQTVRRDLALELLADDSLPLEEIAARLGYSKASNFSRAFQRWTGKSPMVFRRER